MHSLPHYQHPQLDGTFVQTDEPTLTQCCQPKPTAHGRLRFQRALRGCAQLCNDRCPSSHTQSSSTALKILFVVYSPITASHPWEPHTHPTHTQLTQTHTLMHPVTQVHTLTYTLTLTLIHSQSQPHTDTHTQSHSHTQIDTYMQSHTDTHRETHSHTVTHGGTQTHASHSHTWRPTALSTSCSSCNAGRWDHLVPV